MAINNYIAVDKHGTRRDIYIDDTNKIGKGGAEGTVYQIHSPDNRYIHFCAKIYHDTIRGDINKINSYHHKIQFMIQQQVISKNPDVIICWPMELIYNLKNEFVGFIMLKAPFKSEQLEWFVNSYKLSKKFNNTPFSSSFCGNSNFIKALYNRMVVSNNIAYAIDMIHRSGNYTLVDVKPQNILITAQGRVAMVDMDSIQITKNGGILFYAPVLTLEYTPPEGFNGNIRIKQSSWDYFSYAVMAYQIIITAHPYNGNYTQIFHQGDELVDNIKAGLFLHGSRQAYLINKNGLETVFKIWNFLPQPLKNLFFNAFEGANTNPHNRPNMKMWGISLSYALVDLKNHYCLNCGTKKRPTAVYCPECGLKLN